MASVKMPTPAELAKVGSELGMNLSDSDVAFFLETMAGNVAAYNLLESLPDNLPAVKYPRTPGYRPEGAENKYNAWYYKSEIKGARRGQAQGQARRAQGQCLRRRRADDERRLDARRLRARRRRHRRDAHARCRRHRSSARSHCEYFCFSGGSHTRAPGPGPQSAQVRLLGRRLVVGQRRRHRHRRGRHGDRRRPGRLDPHAVRLLRHLGHEADLGPGALHRHHADRADARSHRADDRDASPTTR